MPSVNPPPPRVIVRSMKPRHARHCESEAPLKVPSASPALLAIVHRPPAELRATRPKLRKYSARHREHLIQSIRKFGPVYPVLVDDKDRIIAGHQIVAAAQELGLATIPTITLADLTDEQARALRIALNKISELSTWEPKALKEELAFLQAFDIDLVTHTAFSSAELDALFNAPDADPDDTLPELIDHAVSRLGDIWVFEGGHRLGCLDALGEVSLRALMAGELAAIALCDPPYNVTIAGNVTGRTGAREFAMASGEMSVEAFTAFLHDVFERLSEYSRDGSLSLQFMDWRHCGEMLAAGHAVYDRLLNVAVWVKTNPGMGSLWRSAHEFCFVWKKGSVRHVNNVELGRNGRNRSNVWSYPGANGFRGHDRDSLEHVTPKNVAMIQDAVLDVSRPGDIVLDVFAGSGTTLVAAHRAKRRGYGLEIDPLYVDLAVRRLEKCTGAPARHAETGLTFAEMAEQRGVVLPPRSRRS